LAHIYTKTYIRPGQTISNLKLTKVLVTNLYDQHMGGRAVENNPKINNKQASQIIFISNPLQGLAQNMANKVKTMINASSNITRVIE